MERSSVLHRSVIVAVFVVFLSEGERLLLDFTAINWHTVQRLIILSITTSGCKFVFKVELVRMDELCFVVIAPEVF